MTLYRIGKDEGWDQSTDVELDVLIKRGVLVPVEPCEHGNIDAHKADDKYGNWEWCPGAGVGEETP